MSVVYFVCKPLVFLLWCVTHGVCLTPVVFNPHLCTPYLWQVGVTGDGYGVTY